MREMLYSWENTLLHVQWRGEWRNVQGVRRQESAVVMMRAAE